MQARFQIFLMAGLVLMAPAASGDAARPVAAIKADILALAQRFVGLGDPDFSRQKALEVLVAELLAAAPQPPVAARLNLLAGPWYQVWGPYDYRGGERGTVDPKITVDEIYQVVFRDGYYYNVNPVQGKNRIALLRGEFKLVTDYPDILQVRFTHFPGNKGRPEGIPIWELAARAEAGTLPAKTTIVPGFIVRWFFGGGFLREVYTDADMRITYGGDNADDRADEHIYIMTRPQSGRAAVLRAPGRSPLAASDE
ncbi:MAG: hypothetical protein QNJ04_08780 [Desulfobacterales bacterium]|nr:hypothetical protein [Desulfobacterales bacterium]